MAFYFSRKQGGGRIVIGKDTRRSSYLFEYALSAGISSMGSLSILTGPLPTPGIAFLTRAMRADAGVVISASHNSFQDNGIKFFDRDGFKLPDEVEMQMEEFVFTAHDDSIRPLGQHIGRAIRIEDAAGRYAEFLKSTFPKNLNLKGLKIVADCAHGSAYHVGPMVLGEMDAEVIPLAIEPNGTNINADCGALHPEKMAQKVREVGAHIGIALDGDADRVVLCDEKGAVLDGDQVLALCALEYQEQRKLAKNTVVGTIMNNMGLEVFLREKGINLLRTPVGDRFIIDEMKKHGFNVGGEPSGHLIFSDVATTGDGLVAALQVMAVMVQKQKPLSELAHAMPVYPQKSANITVKNKKDLQAIPAVRKEMDSVEKELAGQGRVVMRYSGTEPLLRLMIEGLDPVKVESCLKRLSDCVSQHL